MLANENRILASSFQEFKDQKPDGNLVCKFEAKKRSFEKVGRIPWDGHEFQLLTLHILFMLGMPPREKKDMSTQQTLVIRVSPVGPKVHILNLNHKTD